VTHRPPFNRLALATLLFATTATTTVHASAGLSETEAGDEAIVRQAFEAWADQSGNVFDILAPDVSWTIHGSGPIARTYEGVESFIEDASRPLVDRLATPIVPEVHHIWTADDHVVVRFDGTATTTSGASYENQFVWIFRLEDGAVVEAEAFLDLVAYQTVVDNNEPVVR
jgi:uncharacterized protein